MTTPTTMTTSKITTVTTIMTDMEFSLSLVVLLEGCVLLLEMTGAVAVVVIGLSSVLDAEVPSSAEPKHTIWHETRYKETQKHSSEGNKHMVVIEHKSSSTPFSLADNTNDSRMML